MKGWLRVLLRVCIGGLFATAGAAKVADSTAFALEIHNYQLFPGIAALLGRGASAVELATAAAILFGRREWLRAGALVATVLLGMFTVAVTSVVVRGINVSCGCFGVGSGPVTRTTILRDTLLLTAAVFLFCSASDSGTRRHSLDRTTPPRRDGAAPGGRDDSLT